MRASVRVRSVVASLLAVLGAAAIAWSGTQSRAVRPPSESPGRPVARRLSQTADTGAKAVAVSHAEFYVTPGGQASGDGSAARPWNLATALAHPRSVLPGAIIWLRAGIYTGSFTSSLTGSAAAPITLRAWPGERVVVDENVGASHARRFNVNGSYTWYWGIEFTDSEPSRSSLISDSHPADVPRENSSVYVQGHHVKFIDCVIHDLGDGLSFWESAVDSEAFGCIIFNNGWNAPDRGHGHGIYTQNATGTKSISDVVTFNNFGLGVQAYGVNGHVSGYAFDGLVAFNNGSPAALLRGVPTYRNYNLLVGSERQPSDRISVANSHLYFPVDTSATNLRLGYSAPGCVDVSATGNTIVRGRRLAFINNWRSVVFSRNTLVLSDPSAASIILDIALAKGADVAESRVDRNSYFESSPDAAGSPTVFRLDTDGAVPLPFRAWRSTTGFDAASRYDRSAPPGVDVVVRPSRYEPGRAIVVVYNWERRSSVKLDLSTAGLKRGQPFEVRNVQDLFGPPVFTGVYRRQSLQLDMTGRAVTTPIGLDRAPESTLPEFGVFLLVPLPAS